ncbi:hypothetical protein PAMC26577_33340 [Caballeronia sordidicola]|uniref:Uncharacterized protein n=1 Tax=Caballeronia sordidicola TaxID=196367 RepID=A0A242MBI7_CABSO|nr:hypothetical protein PAMC26577_33340 [Caballeronia sordidicola]
MLKVAEKRQRATNTANERRAGKANFIRNPGERPAAYEADARVSPGFQGQYRQKWDNASFPARPTMHAIRAASRRAY